MSLYTIKICEKGEKPLVLDFIRKYWSPEHVLLQSDELFEFQFYNSEEDNYSFVIGINNETGEIDGLQGFVPVWLFDPALKKYDESWGSIWKVRNDVKNSEIGLLGIGLSDFKMYASRGGIGLSDTSYKINKIRKRQVCVLNHYYIPNVDCTSFKIGVFPERMIEVKAEEQSKYGFKVIDDIREGDQDKIAPVYHPMKSLNYLYNRYQRHPIYTYHFVGVYDESTLVVVFVYRKVEINGSSVLRIVDVYGDLAHLGNLRSEFLKLLRSNQSEYIDFLNHGIPEEVIRGLGFELLDFDGEVIVPNYFEPFIQKNVPIRAAYYSKYEYTIFRGDADQDRPNIIKA